MSNPQEHLQFEGDVDTVLCELGDAVTEGRWQEAQVQVAALSRALEQAARSEDPAHAPLYARVRNELDRLRQSASARRTQVLEDRKRLGRGRKAIRQYA